MDCFLLLYLAFSRLALGFYPNHYYCFHSCLAQCTHHKHIFIQCSMECFPSFISQFLLFVLVLWPLLVHCNRDTDENPQNEMSCRTTVSNPKWTKLCVGWPKCPNPPLHRLETKRDTPSHHSINVCWHGFLSSIPPSIEWIMNVRPPSQQRDTNSDFSRGCDFPFVIPFPVLRGLAILNRRDHERWSGTVSSFVTMLVPLFLLKFLWNKMISI